MVPKMSNLTLSHIGITKAEVTYMSLQYILNEWNLPSLRNQILGFLSADYYGCNTIIGNRVISVNRLTG